MKRGVFLLLPVLLVLCSVSLYADSLISEGVSWDFDWAARAAYNPQKGEFLVVWSAFNLLYPSNSKLFGPVRGQRIKENGQRIGVPFDIFSAGVLPDIAYNEKTNEYLVVAEQWYNTVGQRLDVSGAKIGGQTTLIPTARFPRVLYNSILKNYLVAAAWPDSTSVANNCFLHVYTRPVGADGNPVGNVNNVANRPQLCDIADKFALAYAPLPDPDPVQQKNPTPGGRYLLVVGDGPRSLWMLDAQGKIVPNVVDLSSGMWYDNVNFQQTDVHEPYDIDVAFGYVVGQPVFFLVWSDIGKENYQGYGEWRGVKAGLLSADRTCHLTTDVVKNIVFPITWIVNHQYYAPLAKEWRPRVAYNKTTTEFLVAWRETSGTTPTDTTVNHIRANTSQGFKIPPAPNTVVSTIVSAANPMFPFVASSTKTSQVLVGWLDFRWWLARTLGVYLDVVTRQKSEF